MYKIDFHIHTKSTVKDTSFVFDLQTLKNYVNEMQLDCIAITNHNCFDEEQFNLIKENVDAKVFPGMEIDIEGTHLLIICDYKDIDVLKNATEKLKEYIVDEQSYISFEQFEALFPNYKENILIPHYKKKPRISETTLKKFGGSIKCGEVLNAKKFLSVKKQDGTLVPVVFSDFRPIEKSTFPNRYTYVDCKNNELSNIKCAIEDISKVSISKESKEKEIEYLPDGSTISTGLNVILGTRTSGKTYNIEKIKEAFDEENYIYIKQFSLVGEAEDERFDAIIKQECSDIAMSFYSKFNKLVQKLLSIDIKSTEINIEKQIEELVEYAKNAEIDSFSKTKIFSEVNFQTDENERPEHVINALSTVYKNNWNKDIIERYIRKNDIKDLITELVKIRKEEIKNVKLKIKTNELIDRIKRDLTQQSANSAPETMNLIEMFKQRKVIERTNQIFPLLKKEKEIATQKLPIFDIFIKSREYKNVTEIKEEINTKTSLKEEYDNYYKTDDLYGYVWGLKEKGFQLNEICKSFIKIEYNIKNSVGEYPSGGEKAEFNLLKEIHNASKYDALLIDEPEASFDNPFINNNIVDLLKKISEKTTVCITTHNSTLAMMLNPDKIIFTENIKGNHKVYYGTMGDKIFTSRQGDEVISYDKILEVLEAGKKIYEEKGQKYASFKNK